MSPLMGLLFWLALVMGNQQQPWIFDEKSCHQFTYVSFTCRACDNKLEKSCGPSNLCYDMRHPEQHSPTKGLGRIGKPLGQQDNARKQAYAFFLMVGGWQQPSHEVLVGMIEMLKVAIYSIRRSGSVRPILIVIPRSVAREEVWKTASEKDSILRTPHWMGVQVVWVEDILDSMDEQWRMSLADTHSKGRMYKKLVVFNLTDWDTVIYLDADQIILRNIDVLFDTWPLPAFVIDHSRPMVLNSGMFVFRPNASQLVHMRDKLLQGVQEYADGNQEFLSHFFYGNWYQIPSQLSLRKRNRKYQKDKLCDAAILHYFGVKPARCPNRNVDCNSKEGPFYSPIMYTIWWQYHDMMIADGFFNS